MPRERMRRSSANFDISAVTGSSAFAHDDNRNSARVTDVAGGSGGLRQERVAHAPFVDFAACGAKDAYLLLPDAQKGADLGLDAAVDLPSGRGADENEVFHRILRRKPCATSSCRRHDNNAIQGYDKSSAM